MPDGSGAMIPFHLLPMHEPVFVLLRSGAGWQADGECNVRCGNRSSAESLPHLPSAQWSFDGHTLTLRSDRHGLVPLYYYHSEESFGVSSSWVALQQRLALRELDDAAIACYLRLGHYLGEDTAFRDLRRMPPNARLTWCNGQMRLSETAISPPATAQIDRERAAVKYGRLFEDAVVQICSESRLPRISLVSGGQDSRHILLSMLAGGFRPELCLTQAPVVRGDADDAAIAERLCATLDLHCEVVSSGVVSIAVEAAKNWRIGLESAYHSWLMPLAETLDRLPRGLIFDGLGGDALSASRFLTDEWIAAFNAGLIRQAACVYLAAEGHLPGLLNSEVVRRWPRELAADRLEAELRRVADWPNPQSVFQLRHRTRRAIAISLWPLFARGHDVALPYLHPQVFDFLASLPKEMLVNREFHRAAIEAHYPVSKTIPFAVVGGNTSTKARHWLSPQAIATLKLAGDHGLKRFVRPNYLRVRAARAALMPSYVSELESVWSIGIYLAQLGILIENQE